MCIVFRYLGFIGWYLCMRSISVCLWLSGVFRGENKKWQDSFHILHLSPCCQVPPVEMLTCVCVCFFSPLWNDRLWKYIYLYTHTHTHTHTTCPVLLCLKGEFVAAAKDSVATVKGRVRISTYSAVISVEFRLFPEKRIFSWKLFCALALSGIVNKAPACLQRFKNQAVSHLTQKERRAWEYTHTHTHCHLHKHAQTSTQKSPHRHRCSPTHVSPSLAPSLPPFFLCCLSPRPPIKKFGLKEKKKHWLMPPRVPLNFTFKSIFQKLLSSNSCEQSAPH